jgi:hypothetical protein
MQLYFVTRLTPKWCRGVMEYRRVTSALSSFAAVFIMPTILSLFWVFGVVCVVPIAVLTRINLLPLALKFNSLFCGLIYLRFMSLDDTNYVKTGFLLQS